MKTVYRLILLSLNLCFVGCEMNSDSSNSLSELPLSLAEAQAFFQSNYAPSTTRSDDGTIDLNHPFATDGLSPDWGNFDLVYDRNIAYLDCEINKQFQYYLIVKRDSTDVAILLYSRLVTVKNLDNGDICQYIATYIPDDADTDIYFDMIASNELNCQYISGFSGILMYTTIKGCPISVQRYAMGHLIDKVFLPDEIIPISERNSKFMELLGDKVFCVANTVSTRSAVGYVDIPGGSYLIWYDDNGALIDVYCSIDEIPIVYKQSFQYNVRDGDGSGGDITYDATEPVIPDGNGGGFSYNNDSKENVAPNAKALFRNSNMKEEEWKQLEEMMLTVMDDCMGGLLYGLLLNSADGKTFAFKFDLTAKTSYFDGSTVTIHRYDSYELFHEMFHIAQAIPCRRRRTTVRWPISKSKHRWQLTGI